MDVYRKEAISLATFIRCWETGINPTMLRGPVRTRPLPDVARGELRGNPRNE